MIHGTLIVEPAAGGPANESKDQAAAVTGSAALAEADGAAAGEAARDVQDAETAERAAEIADLARRVITGAVLTLPVLYAVMAHDLFGAWAPAVLLNHWVQLALITPVMFYTGWPIHRTGWLGLSHRSADMNDVAIEAADITLISGSLAGVVTAISLSRATMRNIRQNLFFALAYNGIGIPVAAGILYPFSGIRLSPVIAAAAMALSSLSVVGNANRLRRYRAAPLPPATVAVGTEPQVETPGDRPGPGQAAAAPVTDPACGMTGDPATAPARRSTKTGTVYFCSAGCAAAYDADPGRHAAAAAAGTRTR